MKILYRIFTKVKQDPTYLIEISLCICGLIILCMLSPIIYQSFLRYWNEPEEKRAERLRYENEMRELLKTIRAERKQDLLEKKEREKRERNNKE